MKKATWIVSGMALLFIWPVAAMMTAFAFDAPSVPAYFAVIRTLLVITLQIIPLVWIAALVLSIVEARKKRREKLLKRYALAPYFASGAHLLVWIAAFAGAEWP